MKFKNLNIKSIFIYFFKPLYKSAFFWLISILISSIYWYIADLSSRQKQSLSEKEIIKKEIIFIIIITVLSVITQELFRWLFWKLLK